MALPPVRPNPYEHYDPEDFLVSEPSNELMPPPPPNYSRIYMLVRQTSLGFGSSGIKPAYRLHSDETPLDPQYRWSEAMYTPIATVWAGVPQASDGSCKILGCDLQIGKHFKTLVQKDAFEAYTSLALCSEGQFLWTHRPCIYEGGIDLISASLHVKNWSESLEEETRSVDWEVYHVDVPIPPAETTGSG